MVPSKDKDDIHPNRYEYPPSFWAAVAKKIGKFFHRYRVICYCIVAGYFTVALLGWMYDSTVSSKWSETGKTGQYTRTLRSWNANRTILQVSGEIYLIDRIVNESLLNTPVTFFQKDIVYESGDTKKIMYLCFDNSGDACAEILEME